MSPRQRPNNLVAHWWFTLDEFMDRAAIVLNSEIARTQDLATAGSTMQLIASVKDGSTSWRIQYEQPPETQIESAVARARPLFLEKDPVFHDKITKALGGLIRDGAPEQAQATVKALKKGWQGHDKSHRWSLAVSANTVLNGQWRTDRQIAHDFIYGELLHANADARQRLKHVPIDERLRAALVWVADATRLTQATKQLYVDLEDAGYLITRT